MLHLRFPRPLYDRVRADLDRPHPFAAERVGFLSTRLKRLSGLDLLMVTDYHPVADEDYVDDPEVGARIGSAVIRATMQRVLDTGAGAFHIHAHSGLGIPGLSRTDRREFPRLVQSFRAVGRAEAHGVVLLSDDAVTSWAWLPGDEGPTVPELCTVVGRPTLFVPGDGWPEPDPQERYDRQSFLGPHAQDILETAVVGVVGLGGGGSHVVQQLAHLGVRRVHAFDGDGTERSNLNRLIGAQTADAEAGTPKLAIAQRTVEGLVERAEFVGHAGPWQERPDLLGACDLVFGAVDTFEGRRELEAFCRRHLIPLVDVGMDVHHVEGEPPRMAGQVILSTPGAPCLHCLGFLTETKLAREAARYGDVGGRPQVVWANGVLASAAVGLGVDVLTGWSGQSDPVVWLSFDGNRGTLSPERRLSYVSPGPCIHYPLADAGPVMWRAA